MQDPLKIASKILLEPFNLTVNDVAKALRHTLGAGIDSADVYLQYMQGESWGLEDSLIKGGDFAIDQGFGVRAISEDKTGFAYADDVDLDAMLKAASAARNIASRGQTGKIKVSSSDALKGNFGLGLYPAINPLLSISEEEKLAMLHKVDEEARKADSRVIQVMASLNGVYDVVLLVSDDGGLAADVRPSVRLSVTVVVEENNQRERATAGGGARKDYRYFFDHGCALAITYAKEAVRLALLNLQAAPISAGTMPVVLGSGWPAVLLHEAVGHGLEGDFIRKKSSVYTDKIGEKVAVAGCTVIDQGNIAGDRRGSLHIDDEGTKTQSTVLIEDGILCGYMQDKLNAHLLGAKPTGNGRRESYAHSPLPRMTNTYMLNGSYPKEEIIASVERGLYAVNLSGGQVDITSGEFVFTTSEAYLIEKGKVTMPIKRATLIGNGPLVLNKISMIGNDLAFDEGLGICGKDGQSVPVGVGQPTLKVSELVVGGSG